MADRDWFLAVGSFLLSAALAWIVLKLAPHVRLIDQPSSRSSHSIPTPRGGGIAIVAAFLSSLFVLRLNNGVALGLANALMIGGGAVAVVGIVDDRWTLRARNRLLIHLAAAAYAVWQIGTPPVLLQAHAVWVVLVVVALAWVTNLFNFMDGIDGIATLEAVFTAGGAAFLNAVTHGDAGVTAVWILLAAASFGFIVWNWPPARIFMGDVGSGFLGFAVAVLACAMSSRQPANILAVLILGGVFFVDASVTLARRLAYGKNWAEAHRTHAYQHLALRWQSHRHVTLLVGAINVVWLLPWAFVAATHPSIALVCATVALTPLIVLALAAGAGAPGHISLKSESI